MNIKINSVHFKADQKLENFVSTKIDKLTNKHNDVIGSEVTFKLDNNDTPDNKITEIRLLLKGNDLFASKQSKSFEEATDAVIDALKKQLEKHKSKFIK